MIGAAMAPLSNVEVNSHWPLLRLTWLAAEIVGTSGPDELTGTNHRDLVARN